MSTYIFVHGAWHGAWCWYKVIALLEKAGQTVIAPDLPSLGRDRTPIPQVSLDVWTQSICQVLNDQTEPCILVGHSLGGIVISQAAEQCYEKVRTLVYLTAFLLRDGESTRQVAETDKTSSLAPNVIVSEDNNSSNVAEKAIREVFYGKCPVEDVVLARLLLAPEAVLPSITPIHVTDDNFGSIPRVYIECLRDKALPLSLQKRMYTALPCEKVLSLDTDHSPFFSRPEELVSNLLEL